MAPARSEFPHKFLPAVRELQRDFFAAVALRPPRPPFLLVVSRGLVRISFETGPEFSRALFPRASGIKRSNAVSCSSRISGSGGWGGGEGGGGEEEEATSWRFNGARLINCYLSRAVYRLARSKCEIDARANDVSLGPRAKRDVGRTKERKEGREKSIKKRRFNAP